MDVVERLAARTVLDDKESVPASRLLVRNL